MTTPSDHPTPDQPPTDPGAPTVVTPVDPTTGYAVPDAGAPTPDPAAGTAPGGPAADAAPTTTWGAAAPPPAAPPAPPGPGVPPATPTGSGSGGGWYRQPWGVAAIVVGGLAALTLSFVAGFATRTVIDRAVVFDRVADRSIDSDHGYGMGDRDGDRGMGRGDGDAYGPGMGRHGGGAGEQGQRMPGYGPQDGTGPLAPQAPAPQAPAPQASPPAAPAPQSSS